MRFFLPDGKEVVGRSYGDIVKAMNDEKFRPATHLSVYRKALAERVAAMYNREIDYSTNRTLVDDLVRVGLLTRVPRG
jgi:hypothetical protein